jgi:hypothetical protein
VLRGHRGEYGNALLLEPLKPALEHFAGLTENTICRREQPVPATAWTYCDPKTHTRSPISTIPLPKGAPQLIASTMRPHDVTRRFSDRPVGREDQPFCDEVTHPLHRDERWEPQGGHGRAQHEERLGQGKVDLVGEKMSDATRQLDNLRVISGRRAEAGRPKRLVMLQALLQLDASLLKDPVPRREEAVSASARA